MAAAAIVLAAGNAEAVNVTESYPGATLDWDGTFRMWTEEAQKAGEKCAFQANTDKSMGIWSSDAHSLIAIAATLGITRENLVVAMDQSSWYRAEILYVEQQTLIEACLANIYIRQYRIINYVTNMTRDALQVGEDAERGSLASPSDFASGKLPPVLVNVFGAEDVNGAVAAMLGYNVLYFRQMAYLEMVRVRLGGRPIFDYSFNMTHAANK